MKSVLSPPISCRYCKYYEFEGHRGGNCQQLGVTVQGHWMACCLMVPSTAQAVLESTQAWNVWEACPLVYPLERAVPLERTP